MKLIQKGDLANDFERILEDHKLQLILVNYPTSQETLWATIPRCFKELPLARLIQLRMYTDSFVLRKHLEDGYEPYNKPPFSTNRTDMTRPCRSNRALSVRLVTSLPDPPGSVGGAKEREYRAQKDVLRPTVLKGFPVLLRDVPSLGSNSCERL